MLKEVKWSKDLSYRTGTEYEPFQFYLDGLLNSSRFDLLLGYFSSSAFNVLSLGFATFLSKGGEIRIIMNNVLSANDKEAIEKGIAGDLPVDLVDLNDLKGLSSKLDDYGTHFFQCISWLIHNKKLQIRIIKPKNNSGIAHYKSGIFSDSTDNVSFKASCNFTAYGLLQNLEEIDINLGWDGGSSKVNSQIGYFEDIFLGNADFVEYVDARDIEIAIKNEFGSKEINELLIKESELVEKKSILYRNKIIKKALSELSDKILTSANTPKFPYSQGPRQYQIDAYNNWVANNYQGVFAMATGTGKTITSLNCLLEEYKKSNIYRAVILVPTIALLNQWKDECLKFNFRNVICISSKEKWNEELSFFNTSARINGTSYIVIVTYSSLARSAKFRSHFEKIPQDSILIADEAHNLGSKSLISMLENINLIKRIGLSATPNRKYDDIGNQAIEEFFNDASPFVYSYSMKQAMDVGSLAKYNYYPHIVRLTDSELNEYLKLSRLLFRYFDSRSGTFKKCKEVDDLLMRRKRIIHKAQNKLGVFKDILSLEFNKRGSLKYTLVYVPEGKEPNYEEEDILTDDSDDQNLIDEYTRLVSNTDISVMVAQYTSQTKDREQILKDFEAGKIHVLTSMKCLDEGVDVPRSELAIFCSSTGNPRQFIQRRGRVLRLHPEKNFAVIHDLIVVPGVNRSEMTYEMEKSQVRKEIERVFDFSSLSMNRMDTYEALKEILEYYNISLYEFETI